MPVGLEPIRGTGLSVTPFQKIRPASGNGSAVFAPEGALPKQHRASMSKKLSARPPIYPPPSLHSQTSSVLTEPSARAEKDPIMKSGDDDSQNVLFHQVYQWLQRERSRQRARWGGAGEQLEGTVSDGDDDQEDDVAVDGVPLDQTSSYRPDGALALDRLEKILLQYATSRSQGNGSHYPPRRPGRRRPTVKGLRRGSASESDCTDLESAPPSVDAALDNSKTLAYSTGDVEDDAGENGSQARRMKDQEVWTVFKTEIVRLTHTMRLKGWRKLPMELASDIDVVRLSGALTNAVYVVTPPQNMPPPKSEDGSYTLVHRKPPP